MSSHSPLLFVVYWLLYSLVFLFLVVGMAKISLELYSNDKSSFWSLIPSRRDYFSFLLASFLWSIFFATALWSIAGVLYQVGFWLHIEFPTSFIKLLLLLLPMILASRFVFFPFIITDLHLTAWQSLQLSFNKTKSHVTDILFLMFFLLLIEYVLLFFATGFLLISTLARPIGFLSFAYIYRQITTDCFMYNKNLKTEN